MSLNLFLFYENNIEIIYVIHVLISLILSFFISIYISKRFIEKSEKVDKIDKDRLDEIYFRNWIFKFLFKISLHKNNKITSFLFFFLFNLSIPFAGYLFSIWVALYLMNVTYEKKVANTNMLNLDEFGTSFLKVERIFGEGSMSDLMTSKYAPKSKKLKALSSLATNISPTNLRIIRQTLTSTDDEIRMFGYAIINKAEKILNQKINKQLDIIYNESKKGDNKDEYIVALASKELAFLYWEMVYTELSHISLKNNFLNSVITYIELSKEYFLSKIGEIREDMKSKTDEKLLKIQLQDTYKICSSLYMLMGRVYMQREQYEEAKSELTIAQELLPEQATFILPYLAEVYFVTGKYNVVQSILNQAESFELNSTLYPIAQQWKIDNEK